MNWKLNEQKNAAKLAALQMAVDAGDASGIVDGDVFARVREALGLRGAGQVDDLTRGGGVAGDG